MSIIATVADVERIESVPLNERNLPNSTYEAIQRTASSTPNNTAISFFLQATEYEKSVSWSYKQLLEAVTQTANMLHELGVGPTDTVSYVLPNLPQTYFTLFGGEAAGIANPINPLLEPHVLAEIMNSAETKVLVTLAPFPTTDVWENVSSIVDDVPTLHTILQIDLANYLPFIKKTVVKLMGLRKPKVKTRARVLDFDTTMQRQPKDRLVSGRKIQSSDIAAYFHTGGTTGTPKLAQHTHGNQVFDGWCAGLIIDAKPGKMAFLGLPLFHNFGAIAIGVNSFIHGVGVVIGTPQGFRGEGMFPNFWNILEHYKINMFGAVPTVYTMLLDVPNDGKDLSRIEFANCGAAPLPVEVANQFTKKSGIPILEGYGLTEATSVASVNPAGGDARIGSIGFRLPYQDMRCAILEGDRFVRFADTNEVGSVIMRGPNVFPGYRDDFHNKAGLFIDTGDGKGKWLNSGDMGRQDAEGYFWLTGRKKELIIRGGHNIDPKQIEEPLHTHPAVALAAAVGRPDARVGEVPVAYIELAPGASATEDEIMAFAKENIGERAAIPKAIHIIEALPQTAVGKIFKPTLVRTQVKDVYEGELAKLECVANASVRAEGDKRLGTIAYVDVTPASGFESAEVEQAVRGVLGAYTVHYELSLN